MSGLTGNEVYELMEAYNAIYQPENLIEDQIWEEVEYLADLLMYEGYDLSDYTWEDMYEAYIQFSETVMRNDNRPNRGGQPPDFFPRGYKFPDERKPSGGGTGKVGSATKGQQQASKKDTFQSTGGFGRYIPGSQQVPFGMGGGKAGAQVGKAGGTFQSTGGFGRYIPGSQQVPFGRGGGQAGAQVGKAGGGAGRAGAQVGKAGGTFQSTGGFGRYIPGSQQVPFGRGGGQAGGGGTASRPTGGGGTPSRPTGGGGTPSRPTGGGGTENRPNRGGGTPSRPTGGGGTPMDQWRAANRDLAIAADERARIRGTAQTDNPLMRDVRSRLPLNAPSIQSPSVATLGRGNQSLVNNPNALRGPSK